MILEAGLPRISQTDMITRGPPIDSGYTGVIWLFFSLGSYAWRLGTTGVKPAETAEAEELLELDPNKR